MAELEVLFPRKSHVELRQAAPGRLRPDEVRGPTVCSLVSPGTELAWLDAGRFPVRPGYAAVFRADELGSRVSGIEPGSLVFCMGPHRSYQQVDARYTIVVPKGMAPETAVLARLVGVSMTTLMTTVAKPGDRVIVCGLGPIGFLAAQLFGIVGYRVMVVEADPERRSNAERLGTGPAFASIPLDRPDIVGTVALVLDCAGHEQVAYDGCAIVRHGGEVVLLARPWVRRTDIYAHPLLDRVRANFAVLRSGWEWELPIDSVTFKWERLMEGYNNSPQSIFSGFRKALSWLAEGKFKFDGLMISIDPRQAEEAYRSLRERETKELFVLFDWSRLRVPALG